MAKIGLKDFRYGIATEAADGTITYGGAKTPGKAISYSEDVSNNDAVLYADDAPAESDTSFAGGTATVGIDKEDIDVYAELLGHTVTDGELVKNTEDTAPYVGFGRVVTLMVGGVRKYRVKFTAKIKFAEPSADETTKGESTEFGTYELEGQILAPVDGDWQKVKDFETEAAAITYLEGLLGGAES